MDFLHGFLFSTGSLRASRYLAIGNGLVISGSLVIGDSSVINIS
jgi:hypothetical protein